MVCRNSKHYHYHKRFGIVDYTDWCSHQQLFNSVPVELCSTHGALGTSSSLLEEPHLLVFSIRV